MRPRSTRRRLALHALGATGFTAYFGLLDVGKPKPGDTVVVSGAAGAVGQIAGQIAKLAGCRTVGIAGGPEKCADLLELYGYDAAIDYKSETFRATLKDACPDGVDVYFDNCGGDLGGGALAAERRRAHRRSAGRSRSTTPSGRSRRSIPAC